MALRLAELLVALAGASSPFLYLWGRRRSRRARWFAATQIRAGGEAVGVQRDKALSSEFVAVELLDPTAPDYDDRFNEAWGRARSVADARNATLRD